MKWQALLLSLATALSLALGVGRWRSRFAAARELGKAEAAGGWMLVVPDPPGIAGYDHAGGKTPLTFGSQTWGQGQFDLSPDRMVLAYLEGAGYTGVGNGIRVLSKSGRVLGTVASTAGDDLSCPLLYGSQLLWVETLPHPRLMAGRRPGRDQVIPGTEIVLPAAITTAGVCPGLSRDGRALAWAGSDGRIHLAPFGPSGLSGPEKSFPGSADFKLAPDGTWLVINDGGKLVRQDNGGARAPVAPGAQPTRLVGISPDGEWVAIQASGSYGQPRLEAWRMRDGAMVVLDIPSDPVYYAGSYDRSRLWVGRP